MAVRILTRHDVDKLDKLKHTYRQLRETQQYQADYVEENEDEYGDLPADCDEVMTDYAYDLAEVGGLLADALSDAMGWDQ
ncbi:hypothetical protein SEA_STEPHIG9_87 [Mycobacterium phage Stephig9]|uniref:Uncharacterized protein n=1 Tax=Mycobacterium phage Stephig9 TaxID=2591224 RepID=A0A514DHG4_9CAUD|nr:hypothetical protein SEA_STEPHIG9_87 [Mycobacterium phage Stephig9]